MNPKRNETSFDSISHPGVTLPPDHSEQTPPSLQASLQSKCDTWIGKEKKTHPTRSPNLLDGGEAGHLNALCSDGCKQWQLMRRDERR